MNFLDSYSWCTKLDVKITLADDPESDTKIIRELLYDSDEKWSDYESSRDTKQILIKQVKAKIVKIAE